MIALVTAGAAHAQTAAPVVTPATPAAPVVAPNGVSQIDQRLQNQQERIDTGVKNGQIGAKQEMRDEKADAKVSTELSKDEAKNGGVITKGEEAKLNGKLDKTSKHIKHQKKEAVTTDGASVK
jgi:hypothetical protein